MRLSDPCTERTTTFFLDCPMRSYRSSRYQVCPLRLSEWIKMTYQGIGSSMSQGFVASVASRLEAKFVEEGEDEDPPPSSYVTHLYPSDCSNIMSTMKSLVTGFVERPPADQGGETIVIIPDISRFEGAVVPVKRKPMSSLSNSDIELLKVWHCVLRDAAGRSYVCVHGVCIILTSQRVNRRHSWWSFSMSSNNLTRLSFRTCSISAGKREPFLLMSLLNDVLVLTSHKFP